MTEEEDSASEKRSSTTSHRSENDDEPNRHKSKRLFLDPESVREQLRAQIDKPQHDVSDYYHETGRAQAIARDAHFEFITLGVITFNALWISIDTDLNGAETLLNAHWVFVIAENFFCAFFFFEWLVRFLAFKKKRNGLRDGWFVFDSILVAFMVVETWVMTVVLLATGSGSPGGLKNASILRMARLLRLSRVARMARLLRSMPELMILVKALVAATRCVMLTLFLMVILMYVFSIAFRQASDGSSVGATYFPTVPGAMHTLLLHGTFLDNVGGLSYDLKSDAPALLPFFYIYVLFAAITLLNMLIGILCEVISVVAASESESNAIAHVQEVFSDLTANAAEQMDDDSEITKHEFIALLADRRASQLLEAVDVDAFELLDNVDFLFEDPHSHQEVSLSHGDMIKMILDLRGSNSATVRDVVDLRKWFKQQFVALQQSQQALQQTIAEIGNPGANANVGIGLHNAALNGLSNQIFQQRALALADESPLCKALRTDVVDGTLAPPAEMIPGEMLVKAPMSMQPMSLQTISLSGCEKQPTRGDSPQSVTAHRTFVPSLQVLIKDMMAGLEALNQHEHQVSQIRAQNSKILSDMVSLRSELLTEL